MREACEQSVHHHHCRTSPHPPVDVLRDSPSTRPSPVVMSLLPELRKLGNASGTTEVLLPMVPGPQLREPISPYIIRGLRNLLFLSLKVSLHSMPRQGCGGIGAADCVMSLVPPHLTKSLGKERSSSSTHQAPSEHQESRITNLDRWWR